MEGFQPNHHHHHPHNQNSRGGGGRGRRRRTTYYSNPPPNYYQNSTTTTSSSNSTSQSVGSSSNRVDDSSTDEQGLSTIVGTCPFMCPAGERAQRERLRDLAVFERLDGNPGKTSSSLAVKKFCRTISTKHVRASDMRPLPVLEDTLDYLLSLLHSEGCPFEVLHDFIFDRTRSIRQDLSMQNIVGDRAIRMYERMVKFHIISHHRLQRRTGSSDISPMHHLNLEQLTKALASLYNLYDANRASHSISVNETEFRSFYVLLHLGSDSQPTGEALSLWFRQVPYDIIKSKEMNFARRLLRYFRLGNYKRFIQTTEAEASYLQYYIIEPYISELLENGIIEGIEELLPEEVSDLEEIRQRQGLTVISEDTKDSDVGNSDIDVNDGPGTGYWYSADSRVVESGDLFLCCVGKKTDGHMYLTKADKRGAVAVVASKEIDIEDTLACKALVIVEDTNAVLATLAASFYRYPSKYMSVNGITGTNGKTTTLYLIIGMYEAMGVRTGMLSTVAYYVHGDNKLELPSADPDAILVQKVMAKMVHNGTEALGLEASSHGLAQGRCDEVRAFALSCVNFGGYKLHPYPLKDISKHLLMEESDVQTFCNDCGLKICTSEAGMKLLPTKQTDFCISKGGFQNYYPLNSERLARACVDLLG